MIKRLLSIIIATLILVSGVSIVASAESYNNSTDYSIGDIDGDGNTTAADARTVLRVSARLENKTEIIAQYGDIDTDGNITAKDARLILRIAAKLDNLPDNNNDYDYDSESGIPIISDLLSLRDYLNMKKNADILEFPFIYNGTQPFTAQMLAQMTNAYYIYYSYTNNLYNIIITEYPGDRIVDAWKNNDTSSLNYYEIQTLNTAVSMVNQAKAEATNEYELELIIHDMLAEHITYDDPTRFVASADDIQRHLTVIGALLDGKANCQGYADAFYTLGSIAGFEVGRMNVETYNDLHITNTICFDDKWYILDVTFDDQDSVGITNHRMFNAGEDVIREYSWQDYKEVNPIATVSDDYFFYNHYNIVYTDMQTMAQAISDDWNYKGETTIRCMLRNNNNADSLKYYLDDVLRDTGKAYRYRYYYYYNDRDSYYTVKFEY